MGNWTVQTTTTEDDAITYAYQQSQSVPLFGSPVPGRRDVETIEAFFDRMTHHSVVSPMVTRQQSVKTTDLLTTLGTIPPENREAAQRDIEVVVVEHGGTVPLTAATYQWSKSSAPPPSTQSVEMDVSDANVVTVTKLYFHYLDANGIDRMMGLMAIPVNTAIRIEDPDNPSTFLLVVTTAAPIQRQGADGHVEFVVVFSAAGGILGPLDGLPVTVTF
jgi:hypothetical protein